MTGFILLLLAFNIDDNAELEQLVASHQSARDSIVSLHCHVEQVASEQASPLTLTGTFWKNQNGYRLKVERPASSTFSDRKSDSSFMNGQLQQYVTRQRPQGSSNALIKWKKLSTPEFGHPYFFGLLSFIGAGDLGPYRLEQLLENKAFTLAGVKKTQSKHGDVVSLKLTHAGGFFELQFAVKYNCMTSAATYSTMNGKIVSYHTVESFSQIAPGIYFPTEVLMRNEMEGKTRETLTTKIKVISVNKPIPDAQLQLTIPHGTMCEDNIRKEKYQVDAQGNRIGSLLNAQGKPLPTGVKTPGQASNSSDDAMPTTSSTNQPIGQTTEESGSWFPWIGLGSMLLLITTAILMLRQKLQAE